MQPTSPTPLLRGVHRSNALERVVYGRPAAEVIVDETATLGYQRVFLTSSRSMSGPESLPAEIARALGSRFAGIYTDIAAHAPREAVIAGANAARAVGADVFVSVGGGSVSDATKHMLLCLWHGVTAEDEIDDLLASIPGPGQLDPSRPVPDSAGKVRMLAVPTMLSAGEFTWFAGITHTERRVKDVAFHPLFSPQVVVLDPAATSPIPIPLLTATGMKAVEHAVEFLCASTLPPLAEAAASRALGLLYDGLPKLGGPNDDLALRLDCQLGSWLSIYSIAASVPAGASHAIGHVLGALGVSHGETSGVVLPAILRWNEPANPAAQARAAAAAGHPDRALADLIEDLARTLGQPTRLRDVGIGPQQFDEIAAKTMEDPLVWANPRRITGAADIVEILELAR